MSLLKFKEWIGNQLHEIKLGSDGMRDNQVTQTVDATAKVAQSWLKQNKNSDDQAELISSVGNKSVLAPKLINIGADAIKSAKGGIGNTTTAPNVAAFIQNNLGLPSVIKPPKPTQVKMMSRHMRKK